LWLKEEGNHTLTTKGSRWIYHCAEDKINGGDNYFLETTDSRPYMVALVEVLDEDRKEVPKAVGKYRIFR
jgi:hypothetical protein